MTIEVVIGMSGRSRTWNFYGKDLKHNEIITKIIDDHLNALISCTYSKICDPQVHVLIDLLTGIENIKEFYGNKEKNNI